MGKKKEDPPPKKKKKKEKKEKQWELPKAGDGFLYSVFLCCLLLSLLCSVFPGSDYLFVYWFFFSADKETQVRSEDFGRDLSSVQTLLTKQVSCHMHISCAFLSACVCLSVCMWLVGWLTDWLAVSVYKSTWWLWLPNLVRTTIFFTRKCILIYFSAVVNFSGCLPQ